jgi:hypothetical protein
MPPPPIGFGIPPGVLGGGGGFSQPGIFTQPLVRRLWPWGDLRSSGAPTGGGGPKGTKASSASGILRSIASLTGFGGGGGSGGGGTSADSNSGASSPSGILGSIISLTGFGGSGWLGGGDESGGGDTAVDSSVSYGGGDGGSMEDGGPVSAGMAYQGPHGIEAFIPHTSGTIIPEDRLMGGETHYHNYYVDARGADPGTEQRLRRGLEETHRQAVAHSVEAGNDLKNRTPKR